MSEKSILRTNPLETGERWNKFTQKVEVYAGAVVVAASAVIPAAAAAAPIVGGLWAGDKAGEIMFDNAKNNFSKKK